MYIYIYIKKEVQYLPGTVSDHFIFRSVINFSVMAI